MTDILNYSINKRSVNILFAPKSPNRRIRMKRLFAIALTLVMLLALLPANAIVSAETVTKKPFYNVNGSELWEPEEYVYSKPKFYTSNFNPGETPAVSCYGTSDLKTLAQKTKEDFDKRPEGTRFINLNLMSRAVHCLVEHNVYYDKAIEATRTWVDAFCAEYKRIGGKLDGITLDVEYFYGGSWYIHLAALNKNDDARYNDSNIFRNIVEDPRYLTEIRPMLEEYGFEFYPASKQTDKKSEIYSLDVKNSTAYNVWNTVNTIRMNRANDEAVYKPMAKYFPDAFVCDYQVRSVNAWQKAVGSTSSPVGANLPGCGTTSNFNAYSVRPNKDVYAGNYTTPASCYYAAYEPTAFNTARWEVNIMKDAYEANPYKKLAVHMTYFNYSPTKVGTYSNTPYYTENYIHTAMLDPVAIMSYVIEREVFNNGQNFSDPNVEDYGYSMKVINDIMAEMTRVAGASDRKPIFVPADWSSKFILSGMYAGGRNIWRITPDTSTGVTLEQFKVKDKAPTFSIGGQTITFPQGRIIADGKVRQVGTCGYWIETPANVMPVIMNDADRYNQTPAFLESFDKYKPGSFKAAALPADCWEVGGNATVEAKNGSNVLNLSGSSVVKLVKLPKNVTAGDSYAKQQAWEVAVTVPAAGELKLLTLSDSDMGMKISDGKVYYPQGGDYKALDGVTVAAGSTYIIKREFDFRTTNGFKCSYSVYDAGGKKLGSADNVAMAAFTLPAAQVGFNSVNVSGAAYLDNIKLYPTGVTTELEAYTTTTGQKLSGLTSSKDAGYRMSWMNASAEYKVAKIYNGSTLVEEIKMAPGTDGVAKGVVKGSVNLSVKVDNGTAPGATNYDNGDFAWTSVASSIGLATGKVSGGTTTPGGNTTPDATTPGGEVIPTEPDGTPSATMPDGTPAPVPTEPDGTPSETYPDGTPTPNTGKDKGLDTITIVLITVVAFVVLAGGAFALCYFVIKPKWLMYLLGSNK